MTSGRESGLGLPGSCALIVICTIATFAPTLRNGFLPLGFDDGLILYTPALRGLGFQQLRAMATEFNHAHYVPLTMLSLALDYHFWQLNPWGYHLTNIVLHATAAALLCMFLQPLLSSGAALVAALIFAVHPVQMEVVSLAVQRKTLLAGVFFFLTLIFYQRWRRSGGRRHYVAAVVLFTGAAFSKPAVVSVPLILLLYDYVFVTRRPRWVHTLPFFAIAATTTALGVRAHAAVGALHGFHGGSLLPHLLMVSRVTLEYIDALFLPVNLAPIYYYRIGSAYAPVNFLALALIPTLCLSVTLYRRGTWSFFCLWWFLLMLLPESNLIPLAQLRADRFLYFPMVGFAIWVAVGLESAARVLGRRWGWRQPLRPVAVAIIAILAFLSYRSAAVWHDDVTAWARIVERHPWCAVAHGTLGQAYYDRNDLANAERELGTATRIAAQLPDPHLYLARVYAERGQRDLARSEVAKFIELEPNDPAGHELLATLGSGSS